MREQGGPEDPAAGQRQEVCGGGGRGEDGQGAQVGVTARQNRYVVFTWKSFVVHCLLQIPTPRFQCYLHGDELQGRTQHPGLPRPAGQGDVQQRGRGGPVLHSPHQVRQLTEVIKSVKLLTSLVIEYFSNKYKYHFVDD